MNDDRSEQATIPFFAFPVKFAVMLVFISKTNTKELIAA